MQEGKNDIVLESWDEFPDSLSKVKSSVKFPSSIVYRGQSNSDWKLESTLNRYLNEDEISFNEYNNILLNIQPNLKTFFNNSIIHIELEAIKDVGNKILEKDGFFKESLPFFEYAGFLRHYGFPSPLLDWSLSPYIAAFFAFREVNSDGNYVSIHVFKEFPKVGNVDRSKPKIFGIGTNINVDKRHFSQQCEYTICLRQNESGEALLCSHESAFGVDSTTSYGGIGRILIPSSERVKALKELDKMNINSFSLFHSDDAFMETMASRLLL